MQNYKLNITYEDKDITQDIEKHLKSLTYTDFSDGKADDLQIKLEDKKGLWQGDWFPQKSDKIRVSIETKDGKLNAGLFTVDDISLSGVPDEMTLKAVSVKTNKKLSKELITKAWENISLKNIATEISSKHSLSLFWLGENEEIHKRIDQIDESDLAFLKRLSKSAGLSIKVSEKIIIYSSKKLEEQAEKFEIERGVSDIKSFSFNTKSVDTYGFCEVSYFDSEIKEMKQFIFKDETSSSTKILKKKIRLESIKEAEIKAKAFLRSKNKQKKTGDITLIGNTNYSAGLTCLVKGFHRFDSKYFIEEVSHTISGGYTSKLKLRGILNY